MRREKIALYRSFTFPLLCGRVAPGLGIPGNPPPHLYSPADSIPPVELPLP